MTTTIMNINILLLAFFTTLSSFSQKRTAEEVVQENLDYYNERNIEGFISSFSKDIKIYNLGRVKPSAVGLYRVRKMYTELF